MIPITHYRGRQVLVFGTARSGLSAARALAAGGADVVAWDDDEAGRQAASDLGVALADPAAIDWRQLAAVVLAPGVPLTYPRPHPVVIRAKAHGVPVCGDIELLVQSVRADKLVGVTGTNGKSTTTALLGHLLRQAGRTPEVGGNIGMPALDLGEAKNGDVYVLELSSYQLELTPSWHGRVAVLINVAPDHLDRHGTMAAYVAAKRHIFARQGPGDTAVVGVDDDYGAGIARELREAGQARVVPVAVGRRLAEGVWVRNGRLFEGAVAVGDLARARALLGSHNWQNAACAYAAARALGVAPKVIFAGLVNFAGLAHRLERIAEVAGVAFINDSKATNAAATARALACFDNIYWIAGGRPKSDGLAGLEWAWPRIRHAFLIGEAAAPFAAALAGHVATTIAGTLDEAVAAAHAKAVADGVAGAVVLLSPACASFDQFRDFEHRGEVFRRLVQGLAADRRRASMVAS